MVPLTSSKAIEVILSRPFKGALGRGSSVLTVVVVEGLAYHVVLRLKPHGVRSEPLKLYQRQLILPRDSGRSFCPLQALRDQPQCRLIWEPVHRMGHNKIGKGALAGRSILTGNYLLALSRPRRRPPWLLKINEQLAGCCGRVYRVAARGRRCRRGWLCRCRWL